MKNVQVAAGILWKNGSFLAAKRPPGKDMAGYWEFPGGKQEAGENIEETLRRELHEELGIRCLSARPWRTFSHSYPDITVVLHFMHVTAFSGEPAPRDGQELLWVTPEEARFLSFLPADEPILAALALP
jgi:8-oxo-dGTP diphosphatase